MFCELHPSESAIMSASIKTSKTGKNREKKPAKLLVLPKLRTPL
jgi:hypothetical protein